jgi:hypothetical protein
MGILFIRMDLRKIAWDAVEWMHLALDRDHLLKKDTTPWSDSFSQLVSLLYHVH